MFTLNVLRDRFHRSGAIEGDHRVDIVNGGRSEFFEPAGHAGTVQLERAFRLAAREHLIGLQVVNGHIFNVYNDVAGFFHARDRVGEDGEVLDAKEIELQ